MLSEEDNERLCKVGPGTPMGNLLRRYWHPVATEPDLKREQVLPVRVLGENLALFRTQRGSMGLVQERCPHRSASLVYGIPEEEGLRCAYHGWYFDAEGSCMAQPFEDLSTPGNTYKDRITVTAYPVQAMGGLIWAYLGPQPAPLLPRLPRFVRDDLSRTIQITRLPCNYLQVMENSMDPSHFEWLHANRMNYTARKAGKPEVMNAGRTLELAFDRFDYGIYKRRIIEGDPPDQSPDWLVGHPVLFPTTLALPWGFQIRVPIDDESTLHIGYQVRDRGTEDSAQLEVKELAWSNEDGGYILDTIMGTDMMAWITPGSISPRHEEHLGKSDAGIIEYRAMLLENISRVEKGEDPLGLIRDPAQVSFNYRTEGDLGGGWRGFTTPNPGAGNSPAQEIAAQQTRIG
jgi:5,5'-dehydrodivanillate O-demethylase oxygenase subunit